MVDAKAIASSLAVPAAAGAMALLLPFMLIGAAGATTDPASLLCGAGGSGQSVAGQLLSAEQMANAHTIVTRVAAMGQPAQAAAIAIAAAYQASRLENIAQQGSPTGGIYQLPLAAYPEEVALDPGRATQAFVNQLQAVTGWQAMTFGQAAQRAEKAGTQEEFAPWQALAQALTGQLWPAAAAVGGPSSSSPAPEPIGSPAPAGLCVDTGGAGGSNVAGTPAPPPGLVIDGSAQAQAAVEFALAQLGKPYVFGASGPNAYDCSGLVMAAWAHAGVALPRTTYRQVASGTPEPADLSQAVAGDLVFIPGSDGTAASPGHVGMVVGHVGAAVYVIQAPMTGMNVEISDAANWAGQVVDVRHIA